MRSRLVIVALASTSMVVIAFLVPLAMLVRTLAGERALREAEVAAQSLAPALALVDDLAVIEGFVENALRNVEGDLTIFLPDGTTLGAPAQPDDHLALAQQGEAFTARESDGYEVYVPVLLGGGSDVAVVRAFVPIALAERGVRTAWAGLAALGVVLILGAVAVADRLGRSTVSAVRELESVAARLAAGDLEARAVVTDPPEVGRVADALNLLARRVVELLAEEREAAADLSHRLRTPLTALRLDAEALPPGEDRERLNAGVEELTRTVDRIIVETRRPVREGVSVTADLVDVVVERVAFWSALADDQGRRWSSDIALGRADVPVLRADLVAAVDALLANVFTHTPDDAGFSVSVTAQSDGDVVLTIDDAGPGMSVAALDRGVSGGGHSTGLGLDIVRRTARLTGGGVVISASPMGGARIEVRFGSQRPRAGTVGVGLTNP